MLAMLAVGETRARDFVRQIQMVGDQTVVYDLPISGKTGEILSKPLEGDSAIFQLYAYQDEDYDPFSLLDLNAGEDVHVNVSLDSHLVDVDLLGIHLDVLLGGSGDDAPLPVRVDEKVVGIHLPSATLRLFSEDPYSPPRTRADQPYGLHLTLGGMAAPEDPRGGISKTKVHRDFQIYHPDLHLPYPGGVGQGSYAEAFEFTRNGDYHDREVYQSLPVARPTKASGSETYSAEVELGESGKSAVLASSTIQIWPVCEGVIEGIVAGEVYRGFPFGARAVCADLYPDSVTYAQIYPGSEALGTTGQVIASSVISFNTYAPQDAVVPLSMDPGEIGPDGVYTIELLTITPFNDRRPERISHVTFTLDRTLEVRSMLSTASR